MTPDQERRGAEMFSQGQSERQVADELGISASSAHRLKLRLEDQQETEADPDPELTVPQQAGHEGADVVKAAETVITDEQAALLQHERDRLAGVLENLQARASASMAARHSLEQQRDEMLLTTGDASEIRQRLIDSGNDLHDWARAIELTTSMLMEIDGRIVALGADRRLAARRAELAAAVAEQRQVYSQTGELQRAFVAMPRTAAEGLVKVAADERAAAERVAALSAEVTKLALQLGEPPLIPAPPESTRLVVMGQEGPGELALRQALGFAERGDVAAVARALGAANGWAPPGPPTQEEQERWERMTADRQAELEQLKAQLTAGPQPIKDEERVPVGLDHFGNPIDAHGNRLIPRHRMPNPRGVYEFPDWAGNYGGGVRTGY